MQYNHNRSSKHITTENLQIQRVYVQLAKVHLRKLKEVKEMLGLKTTFLFPNPKKPLRPPNIPYSGMVGTAPQTKPGPIWKTTLKKRSHRFLGSTIANDWRAPKHNAVELQFYFLFGYQTLVQRIFLIVLSQQLQKAIT